MSEQQPNTVNDPVITQTPGYKLHVQTTKLEKTDPAQWHVFYTVEQDVGFAWASFATFEDAMDFMFCHDPGSLLKMKLVKGHLISLQPSNPTLTTKVDGQEIVVKLPVDRADWAVQLASELA